MFLGRKNSLAWTFFLSTKGLALHFPTQEEEKTKTKKKQNKKNKQKKKTKQTKKKQQQKNIMLDFFYPRPLILIHSHTFCLLIKIALTLLKVPYSTHSRLAVWVKFSADDI